MKKFNFLAFFAVLLLSAFVSMAWAQEDQCPDPEDGHYSKSDTFYGGCGSEEKPYIIETPAGLDTLSKRVNSGVSSYEGVYFKLAADIEYLYTSTTENNYTAIGTEEYSFQGKFNGNGKTISGIRINKPNDEYQGLFSVLGEGAVVENVKLANVEITANGYTGGIVGNNDQGKVSGCIVENSVKIISTGEFGLSFGGIAGENSGTIKDCISSATMTSLSRDGLDFGGIVGNNSGTVSDCNSSATITSSADFSQSFGGIVGDNSGTVSDCISSATITSLGETSQYFGGIVGFNSGTVSGCISSATITSSSEISFAIGGIVGDDLDGVEISNNFAKNVTISVSATTTCYGAIIGVHDASNLSNNIYTACTVNGQENATNVGIGGGESPHDVTDENGAVSIHTVTLIDGVSIASPVNPAYTDNGQNYYAAGSEITLSSTLLDGKTSSYTANGVRIPSKFPMLAENIKVSVKHDDYWGVEGGADGSEEKPYIISTVDDLNTLASFVNAGANYDGKYFNLGADIEFPHETTWDAASSSTENNYTAIGTSDNPFKGILNGKGYTIRGIRIYKPNGEHQGLFGYLGEGAVVEQVKLADVEITANGFTGGIVGNNDQGKVSGCIVENSVKIISSGDDATSFGGIAGENFGTIKDCISSATMTSLSRNGLGFGGIVGRNSGTVSGCISSATLVAMGGIGDSFGGIAGINHEGTVSGCISSATLTALDKNNLASSGNGMAFGGIVGAASGTISDNFVKNVSISAGLYGAVVGSAYEPNLSNNFYTACTVNGQKNATNVGSENIDVTENNGAVAVFVVKLGEGVSITSPENSVCIVSGGKTYCLPGEEISLTADEKHLIEEITDVKATIAADGRSASFTMPSEDVSIKTFKIWGNGDGSEGKPYIITRALELDSLAQRVKAGNSYEGVYFKLAADIEYSYTSTTVNNYTAIGNLEKDVVKPFKGKFNGNGHSIRGIRINKPDDNYQGLFGVLGEGAVVENVTLADVEITAGSDAGGIAGVNNKGEIRNCTVEKSVKIASSGDNSDSYGGIVGYNNSGSISGCTSSATLTSSGVHSRFYGGIVGYNNRGSISGCTSSATLTSSSGDEIFGGIVGCENLGSIKNNLAKNVTVSVHATTKYYGAVVGAADPDELLNNFYIACTVAGVENATNVGVGGIGWYDDGNTPNDVTENNGAVRIYSITLGEGVSITSSENSACIENGKSVYCMPNVKLSLTVDEKHLIDEITGVDATITDDKLHAEFTMPSEDVSIKTFKIWGNGDGSEGKPYIITKALELDSLAQRVKAGNSYEGVYFQLDADIEYLYTSTTENNYTAIGTKDTPFRGKFNGKGHTIRGIRINKPDDNYQGIFGYLGKGAVVENVTLADAEITARGYTGGIVGYNDRGTVSGCISSVTLVSEEENGINLGGVVGRGDGGTVSNNFAKNVTISVSSSAFFYGAVVGFANTKGFNLSNNFYTACTVNGLENATKVGIGKEYGPPNDEMKEYAAVAVGAVTLDDGISIESPKNPVYTDKNQNKYYVAGSKITLSSSLLDGKTSSYTANGVRIPSTFPMLAENIKVSVNHDDYWGIEGGADGSENKPYIISTVDDLKTLASFINAGENYEGKYFNLGADIEFPHETTWDAVSTRAENNFTAIGTNDNPFKGLFNGKGHTIRGIRIYKPDELRQGLFGHLGEGAVVDSTKLADVIITGSANVGGIAGRNDYGNIRNCIVDSALIKGIRGGVSLFGGIVGFNVNGTVSGCTSSATLVSEGKKSLDFGGIVGNNNGTISGCMSSATLVSTYNDGNSYGGIAGCNYGDLNDNAVIGATIPAVKYSGAVVGIHKSGSSLNNNYYATCTVAGENATNVGVGGDVFPSDVTNGNGAVSVSVTAPTAVENLVYDGSSHNLVTGGETNYGTMYYSLDGKAYSAEIPAASGANAYTVYYKVMKEEKWTVFDAQTLEVSIAQAPLTVTAKDKSIVYGDEPANDGVEYSGFIGDETASVLGGKLTYSYDYKKLDKVGKYTITPSGLTASNYEISFAAGALNVEPKATHYAAVQVLEDENGKRAKIDGEYGEGDGISITEPLEVASVEFSREFSTQGYSTIVLPFDVNTSKLSGVDSVLSFARIVKEQGEMAVGMKVVWEASASHVDLKANTPYMVKMTGAKLGIDGGVTLLPTEAAVTKSDVQNDGWEFRGTYAYKSWQEGDDDLCRVYGFAGGSNDEVSEGDFVKFTAGASLRPLRAYLINTNRTCVAPQKARANGDYVLRAARYSIDDLPESMRVVIVGDGNERTTVIGHFNTRTGEFTSTRVRKFDLKGRAVRGTPSARGAYYGKRVKK